jgi:hypothetical protein
MDYFNLLPHLAFASCIHSLSVPYRCKACGGEEQPNFLAVNLSPDDDFPAKICGRCGGMSVAAVDPDQYLAFLTATSGP